MSTASTATADNTAQIAADFGSLASLKVFSVITGAPLSAEYLPCLRDREPETPSSITNDVQSGQTQMTMNQSRKNPPSVANATDAGSMATSPNEMPTDLGAIMSKPLTAVGFGLDDSREKVSNVADGIRALMTKGINQFAHTEHGVQLATLIGLEDESQRKHDIRVYIPLEEDIVGLYFHLPHKIQSPDLIDTQGEQQTFPQSAYRALHSAFKENQNAARLRGDCDVTTDKSIIEALKNVGHSIVELISNEAGTEFWASYKKPGDGHLYVVCYVQRESILWRTK
jgi:hypothetical protein